MFPVSTAQPDFTIRLILGNSWLNDRGLVDGSRNGNNSNNRTNNDTVQTDNGEINFNIVYITLTNSYFLKPYTRLGRELESLKFDVALLYRLL